MNKRFLHILEIGCSGIIGIFITIGYQHFFSQPQNQQIEQIQEQTQQQDQEQTQKQSIIVNIDGKEVSYQSEDVETLNDTISELEKENEQLKSDIKSLNEQISDLQSIPNVELYNYKFIIDGVEKNISNNNSVIKYNNKFYIRDDIVSYIEDIKLDEENNKIIVGDILGDTYSLMKVCPPYQTSDYQYYLQPDTLKMAGEIYTNGFSMRDYSFALFNLNGKYTMLNFTLGHIDDATMIDGVFNIYLDEELYQRIEISCEALPQQFSIPLDNANKMKIEKVDEATPNYSTGDWYGFADIILQ